MKDVNLVVLTGRLGRDPEHKNVGQGLTTFPVAVDRSWKNKPSGEPKSATMWVVCKAWGKLGSDVIEKLAKKGSRVLVCGRLELEDVGDGAAKKTYTSVVVEEFKLLDSPSPGRTTTPSLSPNSNVAQDPAFPLSFD